MAKASAMTGVDREKLDNPGLCPSCVHLYPNLASGKLLFCRWQQKLVYSHFACKQYEARQ